MIEELKNLLLLGDLENKIDLLDQSIKEIPEKIDKLKATIEKTKKDFEKLKQRETEIKKEYKLKEIEVKEIEEQLNKSNAHLLTVKTNEEYRAMLKEIEGLKEKKRLVEDEMIDLLEEEEDNKLKIRKAEKEVAEMVGQYQNEIKDLEAKLVELNKEINERIEERKKVRESLTPATIKTYDRIKKARKTGISRVIGTTCEGCYATLSPQVINELKKGDRIIYCDYCGRIIIWDGK